MESFTLLYKMCFVICLCNNFSLYILKLIEGHIRKTVAEMWLKYTKAWLRYDGKRIMDNLNQAHAMVCGENNELELEETS